MQDLQPLIDSLQGFAQKRLNFERPPKLFLKQDEENAQNVLGKTAFYDPQEESVTLFTSNRHPKDILRSLAHELVHHTQNLRGDLSPEKCGEMGMGYAQTNPHMREMEREAYEKGNMCFRDWEDNYKTQINTDNVTINLKENKKMVKISRKELKGLITKLLSERTVKEADKKDTMQKLDADKLIKKLAAAKKKGEDAAVIAQLKKALDKQQAEQDKVTRNYTKGKAGETATAPIREEAEIVPEQKTKRWKGEEVPDYTGLVKTRRQAYRAARKAGAPIFAFAKSDGQMGFYRSGVEAREPSWTAPGQSSFKAVSPRSYVGVNQNLSDAPTEEETGDAGVMSIAQLRNHLATKSPLPSPGDRDYTSRKEAEIWSDLEDGPDWVARQKEYNGEELSAIAKTRRDPTAGAVAGTGIPGMPKEEEPYVGKVPPAPEMEIEPVDVEREAQKIRRAKAKKRAGINETRTQTPESEKALNESMFGKKNNEIFNRLKALWAK